MSTTTPKTLHTPKVQDVCIDLPGEAVQCWRSSHKIRVILRKHRDVFFDINLKIGTLYTVESAFDFYSPREKRLLRKVEFRDGERFNVWVGREFPGTLVLKANDRVLGTYEVTPLDAKSYGANPSAKPEPLMVIMGQRPAPDFRMCRADDPFGIHEAQQLFKSAFDPKLAMLKDFGTEYDYFHTTEAPTVNEYVAVTEALPHEIQPHILSKLEQGVTVTGSVNQIFVAPNVLQPSCLYIAMAKAVGYISGNEFLNSNAFKETAGYLQENFRSLNKLGMTVRVEKKINGKHKVLFKGRPLSHAAAHMAGLSKSMKPIHETIAAGAKGGTFIDGGFAKNGKSGYGGARRILLTTAKNFSGGMKIQIIGTVIDIIVDVDSVFFDEKGSRDLSEFLARAGVTLAKAGATATIGSLLAAVVFAAVGVAGAPVAVAVAAIVGGYILAAYIVDKIDGHFQIKEHVASAAR